MLTISTFNIQNTTKDYSEQKHQQIIKYLLDENIDILNLQELFIDCERVLLPKLKQLDYTLSGDYRFHLPLLKKINEKTPVITNQTLLDSKTIHLPFFPAPLKRIATKVELQTKELGEITIINTHLDFMFDYVKKRQLKKLIQLLKKETKPVVLTGDFNLKENNSLLKDFIDTLEKMNITHIPIKGKTLKNSNSKYAIDHIFISKEFNVVDKKIIKNITISDHYPVLIKIEKVKENENERRRSRNKN